MNGVIVKILPHFRIHLDRQQSQDTRHYQTRCSGKFGFWFCIPGHKTHCRIRIQSSQSIVDMAKIRNKNYVNDNDVNLDVHHKPNCFSCHVRNNTQELKNKCYYLQFISCFESTQTICKNRSMRTHHK